MPIEEKLDGFVRQYEFDRIDDERKRRHNKHVTYAYVAWGLTLVMLGMALPDGAGNGVGWVNIAATVFFFVMGWVQYFCSLRWRY
jgi:hypothetical protein